MGYNAIWAGIAVSALGIGPVLFSMLTPKIIKVFGNLMTLMIAFIIFTFSCFYTAYFTTAVDLFHIAFARFFFGFAFIFYITPLFSMNVQDIPHPSLPHATGIFHFIRAMVGGIGTSVFTTLWIRRTIFHHERIGSQLTPFNPITPQATDPQSLALLNEALDKQAAMLAINDAFYFMGWCYLALVLLLFLWRYWPRKKALVIKN